MKRKINPDHEMTGGDAIGWNLFYKKDKPYITVRLTTPDLFLAEVNWGDAIYMFQRWTKFVRKPNYWKVYRLGRNAGREVLFEGLNPNEMLRRIWNGEFGDFARIDDSKPEDATTH